MVWAAIGGVFGLSVAIIAERAGTPMPQTYVGAAMGGAFWGWVLALVKNRLGRPRGING